MKKYIDADKLFEMLERMAQVECEINMRTITIQEIQGLIVSLQMEQQEPVKGKFVFPKFLYARTLDNKTIDVSYGPQDMTAIEYVRNDFVGQPEVDFEKELIAYHNENFSPCENGILMSEESGRELDYNDYKAIARHFYELGLNARKEE